eukprot:m.456074 g.456074  ORF g.456074 m.456074 type:complete len:231 (-) comp20983_c0_seq1:111-803(-)
MGNESSTPKEPSDDMPHPYTVTSTSAGAAGPARVVSPAPTSPESKPTPPKDPRNNMIVVNKARSNKTNDPVLETLGKIPSFLPIIGTSVGSVNRDLPSIEDKRLVCVCNRFKEHMATSSKLVIERQEKVGDRVRWVEQNASARANRLGRTTQLMQKAEDRVVDITTLHNEVLKMNDRIHYMILPKLVALNKMLPPEHQLESVLGIFQSVPPSTSGGEAAAAVPGHGTVTI